MRFVLCAVENRVVLEFEKVVGLVKWLVREVGEEMKGSQAEASLAGNDIKSKVGRSLKGFSICHANEGEEYDQHYQSRISG
jgi:hypothetical protein